MFEAKTLRNLLICTSITTCILYCLQISFGVLALDGLTDPNQSPVFTKGEAVGMKMIEFFMFLFFSIFLVLGLTYKIELLGVNILGYILLIGIQGYTTIASFDDNALRDDLGQMPNYCQRLEGGGSYTGGYSYGGYSNGGIEISEGEVTLCQMALASGVFILIFNFIGLFLTFGILEKHVASAQEKVAIQMEESRSEKSL